MDKNDMEKMCKNCKFYVAHYSKGSTYLINLHKGHCCNRATSEKKECQTCDKWEADESLKEQREEKIQTVLLRMEKQLSDIRFILNDNNS